MIDFQSHTISRPTTTITKREFERYILDLSDRANVILFNRYTQRTIHDDYINCKRCFSTFLILELLEKYHELLRWKPELIKPYIAIRKRIDVFITSYEEFTDDCACCIKEEVDWIDQDTGRMFLVGGNEWETTLFQHYNRLVIEPDTLNEEIHEDNILYDNHFALIFNEDEEEDDTTHHKTIYNTRQQYRLKNKNFLKLRLHTVFTEENTETTFAEIYRDREAIIQEFKFWKGYFAQQHEYIMISMLSLKKTTLNNDCIFNIIQFLR